MKEYDVDKLTSELDFTRNALKKVNDRLWDTERRCGGADLSKYEKSCIIYFYMIK